MITLRLADKLAVEPTPSTDLLVTGPDRDPVALHDADGWVASVLNALQQPLTLQQLREQVPMDATSCDPLIRRLLTAGVVVLSCADQDGELVVARVRSRSAWVKFEVELSPDQPVQLSPYALLRRVADQAVVESAQDGTLVQLHRPELAAVLAAVCGPSTPAVAGRLAPGGLQLLALLEAVGLLAAPGPETGPAPHAAWSHTRSRSGLVDPRLAAPGTLDEPPAAAAADTDLPLPVPDLAALRSTDPPLAEVMETRRSVRRFGSTPITLERLSELLFRVARVQQRFPADPTADPAAGRAYAYSLRPVPSAGALQELDYYLMVRACRDLAPGIYRYLPERHTLAVVSRDTVPLVRMINAAYLATNRQSVPQLLISLAARFERPTRKYGDLAYSLVLRNAGAALQSVYLCATAMGLGACAVGTGDAADFAEATGMDPMLVSAVGDIVVGSLPGQDE